MSTIQIPVSCPNCGALFASRAFNIGGNVRNLTLSGNRETCPYCGQLANIADGVFTVADDVLSVVSAPSVTKEMLSAFGVAVRKAYAEKKPAEELAKEVEKIDPSFGEVVRKAARDKKLYVVSLLLIIAAIKSCNVEVRLDANRLIDQLQGTPPSELAEPQKRE